MHFRAFKYSLNKVLSNSYQETWKLLTAFSRLYCNYQRGRGGHTLLPFSDQVPSSSFWKDDDLILPKSGASGPTLIWLKRKGPIISLISIQFHSWDVSKSPNIFCPLHHRSGLNKKISWWLNRKLVFVCALVRLSSGAYPHSAKVKRGHPFSNFIQFHYWDVKFIFSACSARTIIDRSCIHITWKTI